MEIEIAITSYAGYSVETVVIYCVFIFVNSFFCAKLIIQMIMAIGAFNLNKGAPANLVSFERKGLLFVDFMSRPHH